MSANRSLEIRPLIAAGALLATLWVYGCTSQNAGNLQDAEPAEPATQSRPPPSASPGTPSSTTSDTPASTGAQIYRGTGNFVNRGAARGDVPIPGAATEGATLNFESADIREVAQLILRDTLQEDYIIDDNVRGSITLRTSEMLDRRELLSVLEMVLQINGAALVYRDGLYRIVPLAGALAGSAVGVGTRPANSGHQARIIELRYVAAEEMARLIEPFFSASIILEADSTRNLLMIAGTAIELTQIGQLVELFDVDVLSGMSVGIFPLHFVDTATMEGEIRELLGAGETGSIARMVRIVAVERLNALMVVTPQARYLEQLQAWIERLDVPTDGGGRRLYVYRVQNVRAGDIAGILRELFSIEQSRASLAPPNLAPGATPRLIRTRPDETPEEMAAAARAVGVIEGSIAPGDSGIADEAGNGEAGNGDAGTVGDVSIIADDSSNTLVVLARPGDYSKIESAIRQLDVMPLQVLLETTIVEVSLTGELSYGMQWFFDHNTGTSRQGSGSVGLPLAFAGTLSYSIVNSADEVRAILRVLATEDRLRVVSAPSVLVMDNQTANIRVGNQQPVSTAIVAEGGIVSTSVQFKNTGITLDVTPRVNASGLVTLEISQELTDVGQIDDATGQRAFLQRSIGSNVAVSSGQSIVLGGLIRENDTTSRSGLPFLHKIPVLGALFGQKVQTNDRTELLVLLTATVIQNAAEAQGLIDEFRRKMPSLFPIPPGFSPESLSEGAGTAADPSANVSRSGLQPAKDADEPALARF